MGYTTHLVKKKQNEEVRQKSLEWVHLPVGKGHLIIQAKKGFVLSPTY